LCRSSIREKAQADPFAIAGPLLRQIFHFSFFIFQSLPLSTFDIFLALPLAYGIFQGFRKGLLQEVVSVFALLLGFILGLKLLTTAIPVLKVWIGNALGLLPFLSFLVVFVLVILGVRLLGLVLKKVVDFTPLGMFDNILGALLGGLKWCLAISLLLYVSGLAGMAVPGETAGKSLIYPYVLKSTPFALEVLGLVLPFLKVLLATLKGLF
jgi:membrane protein required for colicin V production